MVAGFAPLAMHLIAATNRCGKKFSVRGGIAICAGFGAEIKRNPGKPGRAPAVLDDSGGALRAARPTTHGHRRTPEGARQQPGILCRHSRPGLGRLHRRDRGHLDPHP